MSENTAKILDFAQFRNTRRPLAVVPQSQPEPAAEQQTAPLAASPFVWPVYWVYYPGMYVSSGY